MQPFAAAAARVAGAVVAAAGWVVVGTACLTGIVLVGCGTAVPVGRRLSVLGVAVNELTLWPDAENRGPRSTPMSKAASIVDCPMLPFSGLDVTYQTVII